MRTIIPAAIFTLILVLFCSSLTAQTAQPTFLYLLEGKGTPTGSIHVFGQSPSTGTITEVSGSPFSAGFSPNQLVVDPTGRFVYVTNTQSEDITAFSVDPSSGALTTLPGSPVAIGNTPVVSGIETTGRFLYVFATGQFAGMESEFLYEYTIDPISGVLTLTSSSPTLWEFGLSTEVVSIAFAPGGNYAYLGQTASGNLGAPTQVCSIDFTSGNLAQIGSVQPGTTGESSQIAVSPGGNFLYSINTVFSQVDAFGVDSGGSALSEISASPYSVPYGPDSLVVHPSGNFLYVANSNSSFQAPPTNGPIIGSINAFSINTDSGALNELSGSPFPAGMSPTSIVVDPTGSFAYWTATSNSTGTAFAQIMGYSVDPSSGNLMPLAWSPWTDPAGGTNGAQLAISPAPPAAQSPVPMISSLSPSSATATDMGFTLQVNGANFVPGATVYFGGQARSTTFVNSTELTAGIVASDIDNDGTVVVFVFNPLPGGGASTSVEFPVSALAPVISSISPSTATVGESAFSLSVTGSNFVTSSVVNFNGSPLSTSFSTPSQISALIPITDLVAQGAFSITVTTPSNGVAGGGTSNSVSLSIVPLVTPLSVTSFSPSSATSGGPDFVLTVNGTGFFPNSKVSFNLNPVSTAFVNSTQLQAFIPAAAIAVAGNPYVIVTNPDGSMSTEINFAINNPQPGGASVSPPSLPAGSNALTLNVMGTGFMQESAVFVNGGARVTTFVSSTLLQAALLPSDLSQAGTLNITVMNPPPGGGVSPTLKLAVADYSVAAPTPPPPPINAGSTANFPLSVSPMNGAFSAPITFAISQQTPLPAGTNYSFAPSSPITPGAMPQIVTLSISTTPHMAASNNHFPAVPPPVFFLLGAASGLFLLAQFSYDGLSIRARRLTPRLIVLLLIIAATGLVSCGGVVGGSSSTPPLNPSTGTPAGNYTISVTATSGGVTHSASVTLSVM